MIAMQLLTEGKLDIFTVTAERKIWRFQTGLFEIFSGSEVRGKYHTLKLNNGNFKLINYLKTFTEFLDNSSAFHVREWQ